MNRFDFFSSCSAKVLYWSEWPYLRPVIFLKMLEVIKCRILLSMVMSFTMKMPKNGHNYPQSGYISS